jgi:CHAD domain-containing protein
MSYHFDPSQSLEEGLRLIAADQLDKARMAIDQAQEEPEEGIHDLRKRMKKLRGLVRLLRPGLGEDYARLNAEFRDIARMFSDIRDAQMLTDTVAALSDGAAADHLAPVMEWADDRRTAVLGAVGLDELLHDAGERVGRLRNAVSDLTVEEPVDALRGGLKKTYGRARDRYDEACHTTDPDVLHRWRKRTKYHWYHVRLLKKAWPKAMKARAKALDKLSDRLGLDHDVIVLLATVDAEGDDIPKAAREHLHAVAASRRQALLAPAMTEGARLFSEKPKAHARRLSASWAAAVAEA